MVLLLSFVALPGFFWLFWTGSWIGSDPGLGRWQLKRWIGWLQWQVRQQRSRHRVLSENIIGLKPSLCFLLVGPCNICGEVHEFWPKKLQPNFIISFAAKLLSVSENPGNPLFGCMIKTRNFNNSMILFKATECQSQRVQCTQYSYPEYVHSAPFIVVNLKRSKKTPETYRIFKADFSLFCM